MAHEIEVDWQGLHNTFVVHQPNIKSFFSLSDGHIVRGAKNSDETRKFESDTEHYRPVGIVPSPIQYIWLNSFIQNIEEDELKASLQRAIDGKGAFRRFKDALSTHEEARRAWFEYRDLCLRKWLWDWVAEQGVQSKNVPPWKNNLSSVEASATVVELSPDALQEVIAKFVSDDIITQELSKALFESFQISKK